MGRSVQATLAMKRRGSASARSGSGPSRSMMASRSAAEMTEQSVGPRRSSVKDAATVFPVGDHAQTQRPRSDRYVGATMEREAPEETQVDVKQRAAAPLVEEVLAERLHIIDHVAVQPRHAGREPALRRGDRQPAPSQESTVVPSDLVDRVALRHRHGTRPGDTSAATSLPDHHTPTEACSRRTRRARPLASHPRHIHSRDPSGSARLPRRSRWTQHFQPAPAGAPTPNQCSRGAPADPRRMHRDHRTRRRCGAWSPVTSALAVEPFYRKAASRPHGWSRPNQ